MRIHRETLYRDSFDAQILYTEYLNWNSDFLNYISTKMLTKKCYLGYAAIQL